MADLRETDTTAKPFMFSDIETTDEETCMDVLSDGLGQIEIEVWKVVLGNDSRPMKVHFETERKLHERAKKGLNHCVGLGDEIEVQFKPFTKTRELERLKANGIIPVPAPLKRKASQEIVDLTGDDVKDVKVESSGSHALARGECDACRCMLRKKGNRNKKLKQEQEPGRLVEVIDLT
ncbi:hypothetical protein M405DRAFT_840973 [Rhizopogon salebrosus TDB-379]|nr:hypothetical protein M405DRAFT_840973 [Rhizopogon salebrosus TDB-379]